ncbi:MAG: TIM-barrel domain-containing protein [Candidatus Hydrogenedentota bacterium]
MKKHIIHFKKARFTLLSDYSFKAEYSPTGKFINKELFVTEINNIMPPDAIVNIKGSVLRIKTKYIEILYNSAWAGFNQKSLQVFYSYKNSTKKWYYGKKDNKNLGGSFLHLFMFPKCVKPGDLSDGVLSRNGVYAYYDNTYTFWDKNKDWPGFEYNKGYKTLFFIGYGNNYKAGLSEFSKIFGKPNLPPLFAFGYWCSRYYAYTQDEFIDLVKRYRESSIPIDVMVIDTDWRKEGWRGYDWNEKYFYNPEKFIKQMKRLGIKLSLNDHPGYNSSETLACSDTSFDKIKKYLKKDMTEWRCNFGNKKEVTAFCELLLKPKIRLGIDFWWVDGWGAVDQIAPGSNGYETLNPQMRLNYFYYKSRSESTKKRGLILSRWGGIGSHRYPVWFSGDTFSTWKTLAYQVYFTYTAGNVLTNYWSHDLGGFLSNKLDKDLYIRWIEFGCFSPIMRTHSNHGIREPWNYDKESVEIFRKYTRLRYRLIPYFYTHAHISYNEALPIIRAMYHNYPQDAESYEFKYQYMIGDNILVAPVVRPQKNKEYLKKQIFFPDGEWIDIEDGTTIKGNCLKALGIPISKIPFFVKMGSIIPVNQDITYIGKKKNDILSFEIFPHKQSEFVYYEDDGITDEYKKGKYIKIPVKVKSDNNRVIIIIGKMSGYYKNVKKKRRLRLILHFIDRIIIDSVKINNKIIRWKRVYKVFDELISFFSSFEIAIEYSGKSLKIECLVKEPPNRFCALHNV